MKIPLGLDKFKVSLSLVSIIFVTWVKRLASDLKNLVFISDKGSLNFTRPKSFNHVRDIHSIIDASELFIEIPKDPSLQKLIYSECQHHKTVKVLCM